ncbi:hypothetical protein H9Q70_014607, partial [Fusarium xylarioides]
MSSSLRTPTPRPAAGSRITIEAITNGRAADEDPFADDDDLPSPSTMPSTIPPPASKQKTLQRAPLPSLTKKKKPRPRWNNDQIRMLLELYCEARNRGDLGSEKSVDTRRVYTDIASRLSEEFPAVSFNHKKVGRKVGDLLKIWKVFLAIDGSSGTSYDYDTGAILTSDELWEYFVDKYAVPAKHLKLNGLQFRQLHKQAFKGKEEVRLTAIKAIDAEGLLALTTTEIPSDDEDEDDEEDEDEEVTVLGSRAATSTPRPPSSQAAAIESARKRKRDASVASSQQTPLPPTKRQHRNVPEGHSQLGNISKTLTAILATRQTRRTVGATDMEAAVHDIEERF